MEAIKKLKEKGGSEEESISIFTSSKYEDQQPWPHSHLLKHHINEVSESSEITPKFTFDCVVSKPKVRSRVRRSRRFINKTQPKQEEKQGEEVTRKITRSDYEDDDGSTVLPDKNHDNVMDLKGFQKKMLQLYEVHQRNNEEEEESILIEDYINPFAEMVIADAGLEPKKPSGN